VKNRGRFDRAEFAIRKLVRARVAIVPGPRRARFAATSDDLRRELAALITKPAAQGPTRPSSPEDEVGRRELADLLNQMDWPKPTPRS